jgi:hypothetical protein
MMTQLSISQLVLCESDPCQSLTFVFIHKCRTDSYGLYQPSMEKQGYYEYKGRVAGKEQVGKVFPEDVVQFAKWDSSYLWDQFPQHTHVLTIHGLADKLVPPYVEHFQHSFTNR